MKVCWTRRGARLVDGNTVVSEVLARPGPTHTVFDVLAACIATLSPGPRVALLGFAAGGLVGPLRALGFASPLVAVDFSDAGEWLFHRLCASWAGRVEVQHMEAGEWLRRQRRAWDMIVDDLSLPGRAGVAKPAISIATLPELARRRLGSRGVFVSNLLFETGREHWDPEIAAVGAPYRSSVVVQIEGFENRLVVAGPHIDARRVSVRLRRALRHLGSQLAAGVTVQGDRSASGAAR